MEQSHKELEICVESLQACDAASVGGADRIELCAALNDGGVTPSRGFIRAAVASSRIPIHVLIRPRAGNFVYSADEFSILCADVDDALALGATGIVTGMLTVEGQIDAQRMQTVVRMAQGAAVTFHRAFDQLDNLPQALEQLIDIGCSRVLTSGGSPTVIEGLAMLTELAKQSAGRIRVAAGGGVTLQNASVLAGIDGLDLHASLRRKASSASSGVADPLWVNGSLDGSIDVDDVRRLRGQMDTPDQVRATLVAYKTP